MMTEDRIEKAAQIISERILTPVLYMYEEEVTEFICFCDANTAREDFEAAQTAVYNALGIGCEIVDIREFSEWERVEIMSSSRLIYTADPMLHAMFETALCADMQGSINEKNAMLEREKRAGSYYLQ